MINRLQTKYLARALTMLGVGTLIVAFSAWVAAGHEASDVDGNGATHASEWIFQASALVLALLGAVWWICSVKPNTPKPPHLTTFIVATLGLGLVCGGVTSVLLRHAMGNPHGINYVTPQAVWFLGLGIVLALGSLAPVAIRKWTKQP